MAKTPGRMRYTSNHLSLTVTRSRFLYSGRGRLRHHSGSCACWARSKLTMATHCVMNMGISLHQPVCHSQASSPCAQTEETRYDDTRLIYAQEETSRQEIAGRQEIKAQQVGSRTQVSRR